MQRSQIVLLKPDSDALFATQSGFKYLAHVAQSAEHILGKDEVTSSILVVGSTSTRMGIE